MKAFNIGFLGAGDVADLHAAAVNALPGVRLAGIWSRSREKAGDKASKYGCRLYDSAEHLLDDPQIDAVFVLTNVETHCPYTIMAAERGKHILVEKPAASSVEELNKMIHATENARVTCMPVHNYIYDGGIKRTYELIRNGSLGRIVQFYMVYNIHHAAEIRLKYPGVIRQILTHHLYTMLYLVGEPYLASCFSHGTDADAGFRENVAMVQLKTSQGTLCHLGASFANDDHAGDPWACLIKVLGTKGSTRYSFGDWVSAEPYGPLSQTFHAYPESIKNAVGYFVQDVLREGRKPLSGLREAVLCQKAIAACEQSAQEGIHVEIARESGQS